MNRNGGRKEPDGGHRAMITPTGGGAALGSVAMVASALLAVWLTGYVRAFADDRGLLQLPLAIPIAEAITGCGLAYWHVLSRARCCGRLRRSRSWSWAGPERWPPTSGLGHECSP